MSTLTMKERADRYDALQAAIRVTRDFYRRARDHADKQYREAKELGLIGAYSKGLSDGYSQMLDYLERWSE